MKEIGRRLFWIRPPPPNINKNKKKGGGLKQHLPPKKPPTNPKLNEQKPNKQNIKQINHHHENPQKTKTTSKTHKRASIYTAPCYT